jgi:TRAP-type C4-dicarboxylate transport system permease small subunit
MRGDGRMIKLAEIIKDAQLRIAMVALCVMMLTIVIDVLMRHFFNHPIQGAYDLVESMLVIVVFNSFSARFLARQNIVIDLIDAVVSPGVRTVLVRIADVITIALVALLIWAMTTPAMQAFEYGDRKLELGLPLWILWVVAILSMCGTLVCSVGALLRPPVVPSHHGEPR